MDKDLVKQITILTGSQLVLNMGFSQMVPPLILIVGEIF